MQPDPALIAQLTALADNIGMKAIDFINGLVNPLRLDTYTTATLPAASAKPNQLVYVSDGAAPGLYFSNGSAWSVFQTLPNRVLCISAVPSGTGPITLTCQVKNQDGTNKAAITDVLVRTYITGTIAVTLGTAQVGSGTGACWLKTTSDGAFTVTITAVVASKVLVDMVPTPGETLLVPLQF
jgi:hypothetical protein